MEEVERLLITRRSIRRYDAQPVQLEKIERLLYLASQAPTAENRRERGFVVVGPKGCAELELMIKKYYSRRLSDDIGQLIKDSGYEVLLGAPHLIGLYDRAEEELWDCALAAQNFVLAAHGMGLGTCYNGIFKDIYEDDDNIRDYLRLPEGYEMKVFVVLGYPERDIVYHHAIERLQPETIWKY
jgi:nitroreductase